MFGISAKFKKAKIGDLYMESVAGDNGQPRVLKFNGFSTAIHTYPNGEQRQYDTVKFIVSETLEEIAIDADDRYGRYPKLDRAQKEKVAERHAELMAELSKYNHIMKQIEEFA